MVNILSFWWICGEIVWMEFDENLGMQPLLPSWQSPIVNYRTVLAILSPSSLPPFHDFLSPGHTTLIVQSVRSVGFGMLLEQFWCGANLMMIWPQEKLSLKTQVYRWHTMKTRYYKNQLWCGHMIYRYYRFDYRIQWKRLHLIDLIDVHITARDIGFTTVLLYIFVDWSKIVVILMLMGCCDQIWQCHFYSRLYLIWTLDFSHTHTLLI